MKKQVELILKWLLPVVVFTSIYLQIKPDFDSISTIFKTKSFDFHSIIPLTIIVFGMLVNWFLEAVKWRILVHKIIEISNLKAFKAILNGLAFGIFTPMRVGDIIARIGHLNTENKSKAFGSVFVARNSQFTTNVVLGSISVLFFPFVGTAKIVVVLPIIVVLVQYFNVKIVVKIVRKANFLSNYIKYIDVIHDYSFSELLGTLLVSMIRYLVILMQYYLMFKLYNIDLDFQSILVASSITLFIKTILPIVTMFGDFGVREAVAIFIFNFYGINSIDVLLVTSSIWLINIITPSVLGAFMSNDLKV